METQKRQVKLICIISCVSSLDQASFGHLAQYKCSDYRADLIGHIPSLTSSDVLGRSDLVIFGVHRFEFDVLGKLFLFE